MWKGGTKDGRDMIERNVFINQLQFHTHKGEMYERSTQTHKNSDWMVSEVCNFVN